MNRKERRAATKRREAGGASLASAPIPNLFAEAVRQHQLGQAFDAEALCRVVLERDAKHAGCLHLLGGIAMQRGLFDEAAAYFRKAAESRPDIAMAHYNLGKALATAGRPDAAAAALTQALALDPDFAEGHKDLGVVLMAQGKFKPASACFARALELVPELAENFADTIATLRQVNPVLGAAVARAATAWPMLPSAEELLGAAGWAAIADDAMLLGVLKVTTVRDTALEWFLTSVRAAVLKRADATDDVDESVLKFCCALARQCFNNEYVLAVSSDELALLEQQKKLLLDALEENSVIPPLRVAAVASYRPLSSLPDARKLLERAWPTAVDEILTQQLREVDDEQRVREMIPRLTAIEGEIAGAVRRQYEENPYPRWVMAPSPPAPVSVDEYLRGRFPFGRFFSLDERTGVDILIAGCGTGEHSIGTARRYRGARVLAIDLSLSSLSYAQRKTRELGLQNIEYAQADVLALGSIGRSFDVIDASGVLHHLSEPAAGWRQLLTLLRPGGLMRVGLYSELGRAEIAAARRFIAERGFDATADDIRNCRQALLGTPFRTLTRYADFFNTSGCRDLLFHVQEHRFTITQIKEFLDTHQLAFIGFELDAGTLQDYEARYRNDRSMTDLECWDAFERDRPDTFAAMYQFWCQRS
jgi:2-polyprenyl-3-methyl-5-hydroxy-6-metoxy-1,4-benzoquinol methylase/tetratricopeptide (TPR) repeat protein